MIRKILPRIKNELQKLSVDDNYTNLVISKFDQPEYEKWKSKISGVEIEGEDLINESTGQNICYTAFKTSSKEIGDVKIVDFFYIQKSIIGDFYTLYVKSKLLVDYPVGKIKYPYTLIVSPVSIYASFFKEAKHLILENFPDAQMVPFSILSDEVDINIPFFRNEKINYYRVLFGYEGNILEYKLTGDPRYGYEHLRFRS